MLLLNDMPRFNFNTLQNPRFRGTDGIPDEFTGTGLIPLNRLSHLAPTGYDPEELKTLEDIIYITAGVEFIREEDDGDGPRTRTTISFNQLISGFYFREKNYTLKTAASGLKVVSRAVSEVTALQGNKQEIIDDREDAVGDNPGNFQIVSWKSEIAAAVTKFAMSVAGVVNTDTSNKIHK